MSPLAAFGLTGSQILGLSVVAVSLKKKSNLLGTWLREFVFVRSFERWKERRALMTAYARYRDPLYLAARELRARLVEISEQYPPAFLRSSVLAEYPKQLEANSATDPYVQRYKLTSTVFRLCALLGWLELYRQDLTFLDSGKRATNDELEKSVDAIRLQLAEGRLNREPDWHTWTDKLIFREEQRAIGESMIIGNPTRVVMGYAAFHALFEHADTDDALWWLRSARGFVLDLEPEKDFRRQRLAALQEELLTAMKLLKPGHTEPAAPA